MLSSQRFHIEKNTIMYMDGMSDQEGESPGDLPRKNKDPHMEFMLDEVLSDW